MSSLVSEEEYWLMHASSGVCDFKPWLLLP